MRTIHRFLALTTLALGAVTAPSLAQDIVPVGHLESGASFAGRIFPAGDVDTFGFRAEAGDGIQIRVSDVLADDFNPIVTVTRADGTYVTYDSDYNVAALSFAAPVTGGYRVTVEHSGATPTVGTYEVYFTRAPGANELGRLTSGGSESEFMGRGDLDSYTFVANQGDGIALRLAEAPGGNFEPVMTVYGPSGAYYTYDSDYTVAALGFDAPQTGIYTVVVSDSGTSGHAGTGAYDIHFTRAPGANEQGALVSGDFATGTIDRGDLDSYTFTADQGDGIALRLAEVAGGAFEPVMTIYGPSGSYYTYDSDYTVAALGFDAPQSGTYTVVVADSGTNGHAGTGDYELHFTRAPEANEHGALVSGAFSSETIDRGDLDSYTFTANQGDGIALRLAELDGGAFEPVMTVYGPSGSYYTYDSDYTVGALGFDAPQTGTYTVVVADSGTNGHTGTGDYRLYFTRAPEANEHGPLPNGSSVVESIDRGDLDSFTFTAAQGDGIALRLAEALGGSFEPVMTVYGPGGSYYTYDSDYTIAALGFDAPQSGTYTVVIADSGTNGHAGTGAYELFFTKAPGANEHGSLGNGSVRTETIDRGDLDSFTFGAIQGQTVQIRMTEIGNAALQPTIVVYGPGGSYYTYDVDYSEAFVSFAAPSSGTYTIVTSDASTNGYGETGSYELRLTIL